MRYRIFDRVLESAMALPELPTADGEPDLVVREGPPVGVDLEAFETTFEWRHPGQPLICRVRRHREDYLFEYPDQVAFHLRLDGAVHAWARAGCPPELLRHLLINQAIPRLLAEQGQAVLHASAVLIDDVAVGA